MSLFFLGGGGFVHRQKQNQKFFSWDELQNELSGVSDESEGSIK